MIQDMIIHFSSIYGKRIDDDVFEAYYQTLKKYSEAALREAGYQCLEDLTYYPKPVEIIKRIKSEYGTSANEDSIIRSDVRCQTCGHIGEGIQDPINTGIWECRNCYTGLTPRKIRGRFNDLFRMMGNKDYKPEWA